tara:strand:+ start:950 stop:1159 length:210 start_codon:yes stop_codon:yes gene_type:complete
MKKNMGNSDKLIRLLIAVIIAALYYTKIIDGTVAIILMAIGIVLLLTSLLNFCPLYKIVGLNTCKVSKK